MKKGFTLVELIVSFVIITILSLVVFRTIINIQQKQLRNIAYNSFVTFHSQINTAIQKDLANEIINELEFCGTNCYRLKYLNGSIKTLSIDTEKRIITYGSLTERLPKNFSFSRDIEIKEDTVADINEGIYNSILTIRIPIESRTLPGNHDIIYIYQFDDRTNDINSTVS